MSPKTPQRVLLEQIILPSYAMRHDVTRLLFVGCDYYTSHYWKFFRNQEFWTIEPDPRKKVFGSRHHVVDRLEEVHRHFQPEYFDVIICNGVYGWGLNSREQCEVGFQNCYNLLREGGELVLGWNDVPKHVFVPLDGIESIARFRHQNESPLAAWRFRTGPPDPYVFDFYVK